MSVKTMSHPGLPPPFSQSNYSSSSVDQKPLHGVSQILPGSSSQGGDPGKYIGQRGDYQYELVIEQHPIRARMCGFGDKDRRPITPPPCIRIIVRDINTGKEIPAGEIDATFFILSVDLWDETATQEKNVVRASSNSPAVSISTATTTSFPPQPERQMYQPQVYGHQSYMMQPAGQYQQQGYSQPQTLPSMFPANAPPGAYAQGPQYGQSYNAMPQSGPSSYQQQSYPAPQVTYPPQSQQSNNGMYQRNLIGSLTVNAFTLDDDDKKLGHWFILQDLSVRTEGVFRLKMNFIDVGTHRDPTSKTPNKLNQGKAPVLASAFSQPFQVYSAKKFPGVIEATPLSRKFAEQGIKIPIRKDASKGDGRDDGDD